MEETKISHELIDKIIKNNSKLTEDQEIYIARHRRVIDIWLNHILDNTRNLSEDEQEIIRQSVVLSKTYVRPTNDTDVLQPYIDKLKRKFRNEELEQTKDNNDQTQS